MIIIHNIEYLFLSMVHVVRSLLKRYERNYQLISAKRQGMKVGNNTKFVGDQCFGTEPYLISFGQNVLVTDGVRFITHDGSIQVPFIKEGFAMGAVYGVKSTFGSIFIGDNVFIGVGSIILPDTKVGDNVIISAGSVIKGEYAENSVIAGCPGRNIGNIDNYMERHSGRVLDLIGFSSKKRKEMILAYIKKVIYSAGRIS